MFAYLLSISTKVFCYSGERLLFYVSNILYQWQNWTWSMEFTRGNYYPRLIGILKLQHILTREFSLEYREILNIVAVSEKIYTAWASYHIHEIAGCACAGDARNVFLPTHLKGKPLVSNPGMHHGTCVTHVPWCMSGSLTRGGGENIPGIPGACATRSFTYLARGPWVMTKESVMC